MYIVLRSAVVCAHRTAIVLALLLRRRPRTCVALAALVMIIRCAAATAQQNEQVPSSKPCFQHLLSE